MNNIIKNFKMTKPPFKSEASNWILRFIDWVVWRQDSTTIIQERCDCGNGDNEGYCKSVVILKSDRPWKISRPIKQWKQCGKFKEDLKQLEQLLMDKR